MNESWTGSLPDPCVTEERIARIVGLVADGREASPLGRGDPRVFGLSLIVFFVVMAVTSPAKECVALWNAPDNAAARATTAAEGYGHAELTAYSVEGPGRVCYVTMLDRTGDPQGSFRHLAREPLRQRLDPRLRRPFFEAEGYMGHPLEREPTLAVFDDGRIQRI